jgi:hypothetical protein
MPVTILTRAAKGSPLTSAEMDTNLTNLKNAVDAFAGGAALDAQYLALAAHGSLTDERVFTPGTGLTAVDSGAGAAYTLSLDNEVIQDMISTFLVAGSGISLTYNDAGNTLTIAATGGAAAPLGASYVTLANDGSLTDERVLTAGNAITLTDGGAGTTLTVAVDNEAVQDMVSAFLAAGNAISLSYNDAGNLLTVAVDNEVIQDMMSSFLVAGSGITLTYSDVGNTLTAAVDNEAVQDMISTFLVAGSGISLTYNDAGNTLTIAATGGGGGGAPTGASYVTLGTDVDLTSERVLTAGSGITLTDGGAGSTITVAVDNEVLQDMISTFLVAGSGITLTYNDAGNTLTVAVSGTAGTLTQDFNLTGVLSPAQITADQNNYEPANIGTNTIIRLSSDASRNVTGMGGGSSGEVKILVNVGSFDIVLTNEDASSTAANRFSWPQGGSYTLTPGGSVTVAYDNTSSRWRPVSLTGSSTYSVFDVDAPPASPSALDDEFDTAAGSINTTLWADRPNWAGLTASDVSTTVPGCLYASCPTTGGTGTYLLRDALQAIPGGDFTIVTKVRPPIHYANYTRVGLVLSSSNTAGAGTQATLDCIHQSTASGLQVIGEKWTNFNAFSSTIRGAVNLDYSGHVYLRIRRSGTDYYFGHSNDGIRWAEDLMTLGFTPTYFGLNIHNSTAGGTRDLLGAWEWFRYSSSASATFGRWRTFNSHSALLTGAPVGAQYVVMATDATLTGERVLAPNTNQFTLTDGGAGGNASLKLTGVDRVAKTGNYTATSTEYGSVIEVTSASATTQTLPTAASVTGKVFTYINAGAGALALATTSAQTINGLTAANFVLQQGQSISLYSDGSNWWTLYQHRPVGGTFALTSGATVNTDAAQSNSFTLTLGTNITLANPTNLRAGQTYVWKLKQDGTGSRTCAFGTAFLFPGGVDPVLSTAANTEDLLTAWCDGTNLYCNLLKAFA